MKKILIGIVLCLAVLLAFSGCGEAKHGTTVVIETPEPMKTQETAEPEPTPETVTETTAPEETPEPEAPAFDEEKYEIALKLIGADVEELYQAIGYPEYQDYGPSCLEPGAEDGQLDYEGFSVFTLVQDQVETITEVLKDGEF